MDNLFIVPYATLISESTSKLLTLYYVEFTTPPAYNIFAISTTYGLTTTIVDASDITDFETNYKPGATSVSGADEAIALKQFPEFLAVVGSLLAQTNARVSVGGTLVTGDVLPSPKAGLPPPPAAGRAGALIQDSDGALFTRANTITTRQDLRDDFSGSSITTALTGTPSFTNGSKIVTGSSTLFTTELSRDYYIKVTAHSETAFARVRRVLSDTSLELDTAYTGATTAAASVKTKWPTTTGSGGSFTVGSSLLDVLSGTTNGASSYVSRLFDVQSISAQFNAFSITQRLSTQTTFLGLFDTVASPTQQVAVIFDGTVNTVLKFRTSFSASEIQETTVTLPFGLTTNLSTITYGLNFDGDSATLTINGVVVASHSIHLPDKFTKLILAWGITNTGVPTTTTVAVDAVTARAFDLVDSELALAESGVLPHDEVHYVTGALTSSSATADQTIVSYTVPTNHVAYIIGYMAHTSGNTDGLPVKVGKNTVTTEPAAPGTADGNIFRMFRIERSPSAPVHENFAIPIPIGTAGDVIKITVTPSGAGSTIWRAALNIIVRKA